MSKNILASILFFLVVIVWFSSPDKARAALTLSDNLSNVGLSTSSDHLIKWTVSDSSGIAEGEGFQLIFDVAFNASSIIFSDISVTDDSTDLSVGANCSGSEKIGFTNNGDDTISLAVCAGDGGAVASGSVLTLKIGKNVNASANQITNPASAGGYTIRIAGESGYADSDQLQVAIISGISTRMVVGSQTGTVRFFGYASPAATVFIKESSSVIGTTVADSNGYFDKSVTGLDADIHLFSIYATDVDSTSTLTINFSVNVTTGVTTIVSGIILPPTFSLAASNTKRPAELVASGRALSNAAIRVFIRGTGDSTSVNATIDSEGKWSANLNPKLHLGTKSAYAMALDGLGGQSEFTQTRGYEVLLSSDLNVDNRVNLTDFSILMYNYGTSSPSNVLADINDDGPVNLVDFSVLMYYWSGN